MRSWRGRDFEFEVLVAVWVVDFEVDEVGVSLQMVLQLLKVLLLLHQYLVPIVLHFLEVEDHVSQHRHLLLLLHFCSFRLLRQPRQSLRVPLRLAAFRAPHDLRRIRLPKIILLPSVHYIVAVTILERVVCGVVFIGFDLEWWWLCLVFCRCRSFLRLMTNTAHLPIKALLR